MVPGTIGLTVLLVLSLGSNAPVQSETVFPKARWQEAVPESQGVDSAKLESAVAYMDRSFGASGAKELAIVRNGYLIWNGPDCDAYHEVFSVTKVFTATVLGLLIEDGRCTLDTYAVEHLPELDDDYSVYGRIKLRHLASMTGGYRGKVAHVEPAQRWGDPLVYVTIPDAPEFEPAGSQVAYNDHDVHLLGRILATRIARESLKEIFQRRVAGPIGMAKWDWGISGTLEGMAHNNAAGTPALQGGGGVRTTPGDLARLGLLYLNRGRWQDKSVLSASFVDQASSSRVPVTMPGRSRHLLSGAYGYYWWTNGIMPSGKRRWPSAPAGTYAAHGASTNFCYVIPEWNMVIARMGQSPLPGNYARQDELQNAFFAKLGEALGDNRPAVGTSGAAESAAVFENSTSLDRRGPVVRLECPFLERDTAR
jgi:CubicO group peptidase (beta-lactamase class C family)